MVFGPEDWEINNAALRSATNDIQGAHTDPIDLVNTLDRALSFRTLASSASSAIKLAVPEPDVVAACAATASCRACFVTMEAAATLINFMDPLLPRELMKLTHHVFELCRFVHIDRSDRMIECLMRLPEDEPVVWTDGTKSFLGDRGQIAGDWEITRSAHYDEEGLWFNASKLGLRSAEMAFLAPHGSLIQLVELVDHRPEGRSIIHSLLVDDDGALPDGFEPGLPNFTTIRR